MSTVVDVRSPVTIGADIVDKQLPEISSLKSASPVINLVTQIHNRITRLL